MFKGFFAEMKGFEPLKPIGFTEYQWATLPLSQLRKNNIHIFSKIKEVYTSNTITF